MKATDLPLLSSVSTPTIHPDGSRAVIAVSRPNLDSDSYVGQLWRVSLPEGERRRITRGSSDGSPKFSPDGLLLAFVRAPEKGRAQIFVAPADGGEAVQVTDAKLGVSDFVWSPDSTRIVFVARVAEPGRYGTVPELGPDAEPARRITILNYTSNGVGYTVDRPRQLFVVDVPQPGDEPLYPTAPSVSDEHPTAPAAAPEARLLTTGDFDNGGPRFSPDGASIAFISARHETRDTDLLQSVFTLSLETGSEPVQLTRPDTNISADSLAWGPGGITVLGTDLGSSRKDFIGRSGCLFRLSEDGELTELTTDVLNLAGDIVLAGDDALVPDVARGRVRLMRVDSSGQVSTVVDGDIEISGFDVAGDTVVVSFATADTMDELGIVESGAVRALTDFSAPLRESGVVYPTEVTMTARDGYPVHGWTLTPAGEGPHPVLLNIHGGPFAQYTVAFFDEMQVYADAGYAVVMCNPRGSAGYGVDHGRAIRQAMGTVDLTDVLDFLDGAIAANSSFDGGRVGIMGGSYGGYLTAWTIANDHRFAAAIVERGFLDPDGFVGTSDIGSFFGDEYTGTDPQAMAAQSPQAVVGQVTTPTLVIHSADDLRCPLSQGERYYAALKRNGVETELLIFPGENHELSRSGRPRHRLQRFDAILGWWNRYLPMAPS
jgi:dipeptidyl aminopeptidase/acylaminoacyl peptidase